MWQTIKHFLGFHGSDAVMIESRMFVYQGYVEKEWWCNRCDLSFWTQQGMPRKTQKQMEIQLKIDSFKNSQGKRSMWGTKIDNTLEVAVLQQQLDKIK